MVNGIFLNTFKTLFKTLSEHFQGVKHTLQRRRETTLMKVIFISSKNYEIIG